MEKDLEPQPISSSDNQPMVATFSDGSSNNAAKCLQLVGRMRRESLDRYVNVADLGGDMLIAKDVILVPGCGRGTSKLHLQLVPASCIPPPAALRVLTAGVKTPRRGCIHITSIELEEKPLQERHFLFLRRHPKSPQVLINVPDPPVWTSTSYVAFISLQAPHG